MLRGLPSLLFSPAMKWSPEYLEERLKAFPRVITRSSLSSIDPFFYYNKRKPLFSLFSNLWNDPYAVVSEMDSDIMSSITSCYSSAGRSSPSDVPCHQLYVSTALRNLLSYHAPPFAKNSLCKDVDGMHPFISSPPAKADPRLQQEGASVPPEATTLWMGTPGVQSRLHYDASYNFYSQLYGAKRFVVFPPSIHQKICLYPFLHPASRQSCFPLERHLEHIGGRHGMRGSPTTRAEGIDVAEHLRRGSGQYATLRAGDILFLPAFWFHHVTALDMSVSVSAFVSHPVKNVSAAVFQRPLHVVELARQSNTQDRAVCILLSFIESMADGVGSVAVNDLLRKLLQARYGPCLKWDSLLPGFYEAIDQQRLAATRCDIDCARFSMQEREKDAFETISAEGKEIGEMFGAVSSVDVREIAVFDFLEHVIALCVGADNLMAFLRCNQ